MKDAADKIAIRTEQLAKSYFLGKVEVPVLRGIDIAVRAGEQVAVVGPSGVGKSTLLHVVGALDRPTSGDVMLNDRALSALSSDELALVRNRDVGFVFQFHHLLPEFTALENVLMPARLAGNGDNTQAKERAEQLLAQVGLGRRLAHRPGELSGGECQRVAVARAMMMKPSILLADEPTGNLDGEAAISVQKMLEKLARDENTALVVATHNVEFAQAMDRIIRLHEGRVVEE
jgi:lipoprotein-releasing system ATP-binding protein